jgi:hypothetical protein
MANAPLTEQEIRTRVREAIDRTSVRAVSRAIGLAQDACVRLGAGMHVQRGSMALAEKNLHNLDALGTAS